MGPHASNLEVVQQFGCIDEVSVIVSVAVTGSAVDYHWIHVVVLNMEHVLWMFA